MATEIRCRKMANCHRNRKTKKNKKDKPKPKIKHIKKAITLMRRKSPPSKNIYFIENQCKINISKGRRVKDFNTFFMNKIKLYLVYMSL